MKITNPITLDVARSNSYICLLAKQFDENSRFLIATLTNNGKPMIIPAGATVTLRATRPDGEPVAVPGIINNDGTTTVEIDDYILEVVGSASLSIEVAIGDEILTSASFNLTIQRADGNGWLRVYVAAASLAAGNYYITIGDTPYAFTTTQAIPAGGSVYFASEGGTAQTRDASGNVLDASLPVTIASTGTELTSDVPTMSFLAAIAGRMATIEAEMSQKANIDGSYPLLNAGSADNLMTDNGATQAIPFIQEGTGKGNGEATVKAGGVLQLKKKLGNTVGVNQLVDWKTTADHGVTPSIDASGVVTLSGTTTSVFANVTKNRLPVVGHKYLVTSRYIANPTNQTTMYWGFFNVNSSPAATACLIGTSQIITMSVVNGDGTGLAGFASNTDLSGTKLQIYCIDLTLWFGSNDAIPSDLLSHPENWGRYYAGSLDYAAGYLDSADGTVMRSIGRNIWNEQTRNGYYAPNGAFTPYAGNIANVNPVYIIPNATYHFESKGGNFGRIVWFDTAGNVVGNDLPASASTNLTARQGAAYFNFDMQGAYGSTYKNDITISLYYSGESGYDTYYPYSVLAEVDTGSEVLRSAGAVADEKTPDGTITRRVGYVDMGTLSFETATANGKTYSNIISDIRKGSASGYGNFIQSAIFIGVEKASMGLLGDGEMSVDTGGRLQICKTAWANYTSAQIATALSGYMLYYELATPTTEQGTAFAKNIPCDDFGSLMWTQTKGIPQGNEIFYPVDYKASFDTLYNIVDGDMSALATDDELQEVADRIPDAPSEDGTYTLKATVSNGTKTYSWVADE